MTRVRRLVLSLLLLILGAAAMAAYIPFDFSFAPRVCILITAITLLFFGCVSLDGLFDDQSDLPVHVGVTLDSPTLEAKVVPLRFRRREVAESLSSQLGCFSDACLNECTSTGIFCSKHLNGDLSLPEFPEFSHHESQHDGFVPVLPATAFVEADAIFLDSLDSPAPLRFDALLTPEDLAWLESLEAANDTVPKHAMAA
jgi:hypothetical protein